MVRQKLTAFRGGIKSVSVSLYLYVCACVCVCVYVCMCVYVCAMNVLIKVNNAERCQL